MLQIRVATEAGKMLSITGMFHQFASWLISAFTVELLSIILEGGYSSWESIGSQ
jgi:hypothetical protein